jgi:spore coat polysaccharide biosynthesis predicted glycosyltransferase SpsG
MVRNIEIICDGNKKTGLGHIKRSITLFNELKKHKFNVKISGLSDDSKLFLPRCIEFDKKPDCIIYDLPSSIQSIKSKCHTQQLIIALDYFGSLIPDFNIVIFPHQKPNALREVFIGFEYILIREEIRLLKNKPIEKLDIKKVLVVFGGSDVLNQGHQVALQLADLGMQVTLVQGPLANNTRKDSKYEVIINPNNLPELIRDSGWLVTNGGGCLFEAIYLEKAALVIPQTSFERRIAEYAFDQSSILDIGKDKIRKFNIEEIEHVQQRASKFIDGNGHKRIINIIKNVQ